MLSYNEALEAILDKTTSLPSETLPLDALLGRYLAEPLTAGFDLPMFDNSAVDGYGVQLEDVKNASRENPVRLKLAGAISAGNPGQHVLVAGSALKIMTGAMVPDGAEAVIMREWCEEQNGSVIIAETARAGENIRKKGIELTKGTTVLAAGTFILPPAIGLIATLGYANAAVHRKPNVAIVATGDELIQPGKPLLPGQIYDSNSYSIAAAVQALGLETTGPFHAPDDVEATRKNLSEALNAADVVISVGGVSVGEFDYVKDVFEQLGVTTVFWRIAVKPGKPVYFGVMDAGGGRHKLVFGLPGNPVSALVMFHQLVRPALMKMFGATYGSVLSAQAGFEAVLSKPLRKKPGRLDFVRAVLNATNTGLTVTPTAGQESHMLSDLSKANCLIHFAAGDTENEEGKVLPVDYLAWFPAT